MISLCIFNSMAQVVGVDIFVLPKKRQNLVFSEVYEVNAGNEVNAVNEVNAISEVNEVNAVYEEVYAVNEVYEELNEVYAVYEDFNEVYEVYEIAVEVWSSTSWGRDWLSEAAES